MDNFNMENTIREIYDGLENNRFKTLKTPDHPMWDQPVIGFARGDDPYFAFLKDHIGSFHWSAEEAFRLKYPGSVRERDLSVVSMAFPQTMETKAAQAKETFAPAREWIVSRGEWEPLMKEFSGKLTRKLEDMGIRSVSIDLLPEFSTVKSSQLGIASNWSHRHIAYLAGLGTFGLSEGLITERGKAVRFTSLIVEAEFIPTERAYQSHYEWCLFFRDGSCGACIRRCPVNAISKEGHDKDLCDAYEEVFAAKYWPDDIERGNYILGCGLCQAGIPCQHGRP